MGKVGNGMKMTLTLECDGKTRSMSIIWRKFTPKYKDWIDDLLFDLSSCASIWKEFWNQNQKTVK